MSAISGAKVTELPNPISRLAMANSMRLGASPEAMNASPRVNVAATTGLTMPKRSTSCPINTAPPPKPSIASVYGIDASARATLNSACTDGRVTTTAHMPTLPTDPISRHTISRSQA